MALPTVGQDRSTWGYILLEFLRSIHNEDGTLTDEYLAIIRNGLATDEDVDALTQALNVVVGDLSDLSGVVAGVGDDLTNHVADTANPHAVSKSQVGLGSVPNTDATLRANHTGTQAISTVTGLQAAIDAKADASALTSHTGNTSNPHTVTKTQVGLGNVPNVDATARANHTGTQAISTITGLQTALDALALRPVTNITANYTALATDYTIRADATAAPIVITLPAATVIGKVYEVSKIDASANTVVIDGLGGDVINVPGSGPELTVMLSGQFDFIILKCLVANEWDWVSAVGNVT